MQEFGPSYQTPCWYNRERHGTISKKIGVLFLEFELFYLSFPNFCGKFIQSTRFISPHGRDREP
jgi:hypothetical protein